jgi:hypothetical protein
LQDQEADHAKIESTNRKSNKREDTEEGDTQATEEVAPADKTGASSATIIILRSNPHRIRPKKPSTPHSTDEAGKPDEANPDASSAILSPSRLKRKNQSQDVNRAVQRLSGLFGREHLSSLIAYRR